MTVDLKMSLVTLGFQGLHPHSPALYSHSFLECQYHSVRAEMGPVWLLPPMPELIAEGRP